MSRVAVFDLDGVLFDPTMRKIAYGVSVSIERKQAEVLYESGHYLQLDEVIEGSLDCVLYYETEGYEIVYLSGRRESATQATIEALLTAGFPVTQDNLHLKPTKDDCTIEFKHDVLSTYVKLFEEVIFFDDTESNRDVGHNLGIRTFSKCTILTA
jgi:FMN phosphatase YigB (HAD superfamily)